ncbi:MAG: DUF2934 domain-containing protein [Gammaproteobacteria bacterium]|nr:DUF2934 domain-containing protein [Gammaproteobacteria bacterium]
MTNASITKPRTKKSSATTKTESPRILATTSTKIGINPTDRYQLIATAAYLRAEARGFQGEDSLNDWLAAEAEIDSRYSVKP